MNINATEELIRIIDELDIKLTHLESSPNRTFVLIEYDTLHSFHWFNLCFKQFCEEFNRQSASQLLLFDKFTDSFSKLWQRYYSLLKGQINYLESVLDFEYKCVKELPPVIFSEDNTTDVIGHYMEVLKNSKDEQGNPLYHIELDSNTDYEVIDGKDVPINFYIFRNNKLNDVHYNSLFGMYNCMKSILELMAAVVSYPTPLQIDLWPTQEEIICTLDQELRQYANAVGNKVERDLRKIAQTLKPYRNSSLTTDVWGLVMEQEDDLFDLAIKEQLEKNTEKRFDDIDTDRRKVLSENYSLLQKIKSASIDEELFDIDLAVKTHQLFAALKADNLDLFYELVLRRNIIHREMFPDKLEKNYEEWLNKTNEQQPEKDEDTGLSEVRQSKLDEIIGILQRGKWKQPATADNIEQLLNTIFGKDTSLLDEDDESQCEKMWSLVESGSGDRMLIVPANLAGFFLEENLLKGSPKEISTALFSNGDQANNINKGNSNRCSTAFTEIIPFLKKYIDKIIRQV